MNFYIIVAMDKNRLIGNKGRLPWNIPEDMAWFKQQTMNHPVIMGRKTWQSLKRALVGRRNIVLSSNPNFNAPGAEVISGFSELTTLLADQTAFVIGGASVFNQFLPLSQKLYITKISAQYRGDTFFPAYNENDWELAETKPLQTANGLQLSFCIYTKKTDN